MSGTRVWFLWLFLGLAAAILGMRGVPDSVIIPIYLGASGLLLGFYWLDSFLLQLQQRSVNRSMLSFLRRLGRTDKARDAEARMNSLVTRFLLPLVAPWMALRRTVTIARDLASTFQFARFGLSEADEETLAALQQRQMKLLGRKSVARGRCKNLSGHSPFMTVDYARLGSEARMRVWCKYCLVSWRDVQSLPTIVHPPR